MEDINKFRKKLRKKARLKKFAAVLIMGLFIAGLYFASIYFSKNAEPEDLESGVEFQGFPLVFAGERVLKLDCDENYLCALTDKQLAFYSVSGNKIAVYQHGFNLPMIKASSGHTVLYETGGNKVLAYRKSSQYFNKEFANRILLCEITPDGYIGVVTEHDRYAGVLMLYNPDGENVFEWNCAVDQIAGLSLQKSGKSGTVLGITSKDGVIHSKVIGLDFTAGKESFNISVQGGPGLSIAHKKNGVCHVICEQGLSVVNGQGEILSYSEFIGVPAVFDNRYEGNTPIVFEESINNASLTKIYSQDGSLYKEYKSEENILNIWGTDTGFLLLCENSTLVFDGNLNLIQTHEINKSKGLAALLKNNLFQSGTLGIEKVTIK